MPARSLCRAGLLFALTALLTASSAEFTFTAEPAEQKGKPNRLAKESSPYLLQHASNPVDWFPWGAEAFEKAKKEKKLVFLSIGYSSCHWCHVMERESFSNADIAKVMNEHFVCIKVDREERPDIDDIYMTAVNVAGESGGWPLNVFLTSDGKPIFGGTYFPPEDRKLEDGTAPGFKSILKKVIDLHAKEHDGLMKQADKIADLTVEALERNSRVGLLVPLDRELVKDAVGAFDIDPEFGGIGNKDAGFRHAKFPRATAWVFLLQQGRKAGNEPYAKAAALTLRKMAEGGIYDQLGGGFHRYSTERTWTVPHFEKMLYDNAQLVELYAEAYKLQPDPLYKRVIAESLTFVKREMTGPEGAFYSALDADSNGKEGEFYVWTADELKQVLGNEADTAFVRGMYGVTTPNFEEKFHILRLPKPTAELAKEQKLTEEQLLSRLEPLKAKLLAARAKRVRPFLDTKVISGWNGLMIAAYARAAEVLKDKEYGNAAAKAADFLLTKMRDKDGRLLRIYAAAPGGTPVARVGAFLEDYAYLIHGLLNLHEATGEKRWLDEAKALTEVLMKNYADTARGGFYYTPHDHEKLFARAKDTYDGAQPSGNGVMARNLLQLAKKTGEAKYKDFGGKSIRAFAGVLKANPASVPGMARALDEMLDAEASPGREPGEKSPEVPQKPRASADVVKAECKAAEPNKDGARVLTITLTVAEPWHVYANPIGNDELKASETKVELLTDGKPVKAAIEFPKGQEVKDSTGAMYRVYEGTVTITATLPAGGKDDPLPEARVRVIACKEGTCLAPSTLKLRVK